MPPLQATVPVAVLSPDQPEISPKVQALKGKLQLLLKEHLEQQLAPKQDKGLLMDLQLRLLHLMQQPIQNQYEIKMIQAQLEQQLKKKLTPKENMERYRQMQLLLEEIDGAQKQDQAKKAQEPAQTPAQAVKSQTDLMLKQILDAVSKPGATVAKPVEATDPAPTNTDPLMEWVKTLSREEQRALLKKFFKETSEEAAKKVVEPPVKEKKSGVKKEGENREKKDRTAYVSVITDSSTPGYTRKREVYNADGKGFFRALGFELLHAHLNEYKYTDLFNYINNVVIKDDQMNEDVLNCLTDFAAQIAHVKDGNLAGYVSNSDVFDHNMLCAMTAITLAYMKQHPEHPEYKDKADIIKNGKPITVAVMTPICQAFKANVRIVDGNKFIQGDAGRTSVDAYIQTGDGLHLLYTK
jgi:uncharacterized protein YdaT